MTEFSTIDPQRLLIPFVKSVFEGECLDATVYGYADGHEQFQVTKEGVFWQKPKASNQAPDPPRYKISGPLVAIGKSFDIERSETGLYLRFVNQNLEEVTTHILRQDLKRPKILLAKLYGLDFYLNPEWERKFVLYLSKLNPTVTQHCLGRTGWACQHSVFVLPTECIQHPEAKAALIFQPHETHRLLSAFKPKGCLTDWKNHVAAPCQGNPVPVFAIATALAGPLLVLAGMDSFCLHLYGKSSGGKTTTLQVAASVWGCGADPASAPEASFVNRWNMTKNALGRLAALVNDTLLVLDEVGTYDTQDFGATIYDFLGGSGKGGLKFNQQLREQHHWRIITLSSGEASGRYKIETKRRALAGQLTRFVDIPVLEDIFSQPGERTPGEFAHYLKEMSGQYYGTAGPHFIRTLFRYTEDTYKLSVEFQRFFQKNLEDLEAYASVTLTQEKLRTLRRFALIQTAGQLASRAEIVPFDEAEIKAAVRYMFSAWLREAASMNDGDRMLQSLYNFLVTHQTRFVNLDTPNAKLTGTVSGYVSAKKQRFLLTEDAFKAACSDFDERMVAEELARRRILVQHRETVKGIPKNRYKIRCKVPTVLGNQYVRLYAIKFSILDKNVTL